MGSIRKYSQADKLLDKGETRSERQRVSTLTNLPPIRMVTPGYTYSHRLGSLEFLEAERRERERSRLQNSLQN